MQFSVFGTLPICCQMYKNLKDVVVTSYRRCLCYPLYRHWKLTSKVFRDVQKIFIIGKDPWPIRASLQKQSLCTGVKNSLVFCVGRHRLLKCLLEMHQLLLDCESRYVLNDLYIADYCVWLQSVSQTQLKSLARNLAKVGESNQSGCSTCCSDLV